MDWRTRAVRSWKLSNTLEGMFCIEAFEEALRIAGRAPEIFNTDQGSQFTSQPQWQGGTQHCLREGQRPQRARV